MLIPKNGRIVIVDDSLVQAYPLIKALSFNKFPFTYHTEKVDQLPATPYDDVRLIFLDINLTEGVNTEAAISSQLQTTLEHLITPGTPYVAAIWSIKENDYQELLEDLFNNKIPQLKPLTQISLAKSELFSLDVDTGQYAEDDTIDIIDVINTKLNEEINKINSFKALIIWEHIVQDSAQETVHQFSKIVANNEFWHNNLKHILYKMAHAQLGQTITDVSEKEILQAALRTMTSSFEGKVETKLNDTALMIDDIDLKNEGPVYTAEIDGVKVELKWDNVKKWVAFFDTIQKAESAKGIAKLNSTAADNVILDKLKGIYKVTSPKLNTELLVSSAVSPVLYPGNVYLKTVTDAQKRDLVKTYFKQVAAKTTGNNPVFAMPDADLAMFKLIEMECTPLCDFSQKKRLRTRILPGLLYNAKFDKEINAGDSFYQEIPPFEYDGEIYKILFDYRLFKSHNIEKNALHPSAFLFKLKNEVVTDVLARISSHVNRPGITTVS